MDPKKYVLLWIPESGLFFNGGQFRDGFGHEIRWDRTLTLFDTASAVDVEKKKIIKQFPRAKGELSAFAVTVKKGKSDASIEFQAAIRSEDSIGDEEAHDQGEAEESDQGGGQTVPVLRAKTRRGF